MRRTFVTVLLRQALKIRYWVIGGIVGGGVMADSVSYNQAGPSSIKLSTPFQYYEQWKKSLPEFTLPEWVKLDPDSPLAQQLDKWKTGWADRDRTMLREWTSKVKALHESWKLDTGVGSGLLPITLSSTGQVLHYEIQGAGGGQVEGASGGERDGEGMQVI